MKISEIIEGLKEALVQVGDIEVEVDATVGAADSFPTLHLAWGDLDGQKYCDITSGYRKQDDPMFDSDDPDEGSEADTDRLCTIFEAVIEKFKEERG